MIETILVKLGFIAGKTLIRKTKKIIKKLLILIIISLIAYFLLHAMV